MTEADRFADNLIRERLHEAFPTDAILSEEFPDDLSRLAHERLWLVDPLDGTRQFVERIPEFAVMIGLAVRGEPRLGVVHLPAERLTYAAAVSDGAFEQRGDEAWRRLELPPWDGSTTGPVVTVSRFNATSRTRLAAEQLGARQVVVSGSVGRKAVLVASGRADAYLSLGRRSRHWDACAPEAIIRAAGGFFGQTTGERIAYNIENTRNERGLAACRPGLEERLVSAIAHARRSDPEQAHPSG